MTDQEKDKYKNFSDYFEELELRIKVQQQKKAEEARKLEIERALSAKQEREELEKYAPLADEIADSPKFKHRFCQLIANKNTSHLSDVIDVANTILMQFNFPLGLSSLIVTKIAKIAVDKYCEDLKK